LTDAAISFRRWAVETVASSRSSALIRIGLGLLIWVRFASEQLPFRHDFGGRWVFSIAFFCATTLMVIGYRARLATFTTGVLASTFYYYFGLIEDFEPYTHHHTYWLGMATLLCSLTPCGQSYSVDRWIEVKKADARGQTIPPEAGNIWGLRLIVIQLSLMYFWSAYDKCHPGFLNGDRLQAIFMYYYIGSNLDQWDAWAWVFQLAAWIVVTLEFALAFGLPFKATRYWLVLPGIGLHAMFYLLLPVSTYSATIVLLYLAYLDPDDVHLIIDRLSGVDPDEGIKRQHGS
jgi:hypothetical protein